MTWQRISVPQARLLLKHSKPCCIPTHRAWKACATGKGRHHIATERKGETLRTTILWRKRKFNQNCCCWSLFHLCKNDQCLLKTFKWLFEGINAHRYGYMYLCVCRFYYICINMYKTYLSQMAKFKVVLWGEESWIWSLWVPSSLRYSIILLNI